MKILCYCPQNVLGGGSRFFSQLIPAITRNSSVESISILTHDKSINQSLFESSVLSKTIKIVYLPLPFWLRWLMQGKRLWRSKRLWRIVGTRLIGLGLAKVLKGGASNWLLNWQKKQVEIEVKKCDLVYYFWPHFCQCPKIDKPIVCTFQDTILLDFPEIAGGPETKKEWLRAKNWVQNSCVVVSSDNTKNRLIDHFGNSINSISKIPHATLPWEFNNTLILDSEILSRLPKEYILYPANITVHKNHYNLLIALSKFFQQHNVPIVFFGHLTEVLTLTKPNWEEQSYQASRLIGLKDRLKMSHGKDFYALGYINDLDALALLQNAKALVMPSLEEGGGSYPVEEALTFGIPVLCSDIPVMREHLCNWDTKIVWFDPYSTDSIFTALNEMMNNYDIYKQSAIDNMNTKRLSWDEIASNYVEVFKQALASYKLKN